MRVRRGLSWKNISHNHPVLVRQVLRAHLCLDSEVTPDNTPLLEQAFERDFHRVRWNSEADPLRTAGARNDRSINSDHFTIEVNQRSAAVSRIDSGVGLQKITEAIHPIRTSLRADDSLCHGLLEAEGIAYGQHHVPGLYRVGIAQLQWFYPRLIDF